MLLILPGFAPEVDATSDSARWLWHLIVNQRALLLQRMCLSSALAVMPPI